MPFKKIYLVGWAVLTAVFVTLLYENSARAADSSTASLSQEVYVQSDLVLSRSVSDSALPDDVASKLSLPPLPDYALSLKKLLVEPNPDEILRNVTAADYEKDAFLSLAQQWQKAVDAFQVPENGAVQKSKAEIIRSMQALEKWFNTNRVEGNTWKKRLNWDAMSREMKKPGLPDIYVLENAYSRLSSGAFGLELASFADLRLAIQKYVTVMTVRAKPDEAKEMYQRVTKMLAVLTAEASKNPHTDTRRAVEACLRWMDWTDQSAELVEKTRQQWNQPNFMVDVAGTLFQRYGTKELNEPQTIREVVGQANIQGTATFEGALKVFPVPNDKKVEIRIQLEGVSRGSTVATQGPATVRSQSVSNISANKTLFMDYQSVAATKARAEINTDSQITSVNVSGRMGQAVAERRAHEQKGQTQRTLSARNAARIENRLNQSLEAPIQKINQGVYQDLRKQLEPRGIMFSQTQMYSDDKQITLQSSLSTMKGLTASSAPPAPANSQGSADVQISLHESAIQNICTGFFSGMLLDKKAAQQFKKSAPKWLHSAEKAADGEKSVEGDDEPPAIEFSSQFPVIASFADGKIVVSIYGKQFISNEKSYPAMRITVAYNLVQEDGKFFLVRDGNFELLPPGFDPEVDKQLPSSVTTLRRVIARQLKSLLEEKIELKTIPLNPKNDTKKPVDGVGELREMQMRPISVTIHDGWMQVGFQVEPLDGGQ